jgi:hypothetical protein
MSDMVTTVPLVRLTVHDDSGGARLLLTLAALVEAAWCLALLAIGVWLLGAAD